jgi:hypothetical protein
MPFIVTVGNREWRTDDLTLDEAIKIEEAIGRTWLEINPFRSAVDAKAIMVTFLTREMAPDAAAAKVGALSLREVLDGVKTAKDDLPDTFEDGIPKAEDGPSTDGSSHVPAGSDGPPH